MGRGFRHVNVYLLKVLAMAWRFHVRLPVVPCVLYLRSEAGKPFPPGLSLWKARRGSEAC